MEGYEILDVLSGRAVTVYSNTAPVPIASPVASSVPDFILKELNAMTGAQTWSLGDGRALGHRRFSTVRVAIRRGLATVGVF